MRAGPIQKRTVGGDVLKAVLGAFAGALVTIVASVLLYLSQQGPGAGGASSGQPPPTEPEIELSSSPMHASAPQPQGTPAATLPTATGAALQVCNRSTERSALALGYRAGDTWVSEGWHVLDRDQCLPVAGPAAGETVYYRAVGERGGSWGSDYTLCVQPAEAFRIEGTAECEARGFQTALFDTLEIPADPNGYTLTLTGGTPDPLDELEEGDGVYVQGWLADEMSIVMRVDRAARRVKVRRSEDLTTVWVPADRIITREQAQLNEVGRTAAVLTIGFCMLFPDKCDTAGSQ